MTHPVDHHNFRAGHGLEALGILRRDQRILAPEQQPPCPWKDPRLHTDFYALTYENVRTALSIIANLAIVSVDKRVADRLLLETEARPNADGWIHVSRPDLAQLLAVSLPTLRRTIARLVGAGLVEQGYGRVKVVDRKGLQQICRN